MGFFLIGVASLAVAMGSYLIASSLPGAALTDFWKSILQIQRLNLCFGVCLNLLGSVFLAAGRSRLTSYALAWNFYLILLIGFGSLIAVVSEKERFSPSQYAGASIAVLAIVLMSKK